MATVVIDITTPGSGSHTIDSAVSGNVTVEAWGAGGYCYAPYGAAGGGGAYARGDFTLAGGTVLNYDIDDLSAPFIDPDTVGNLTRVIDSATSGSTATVKADSANYTNTGNYGGHADGCVVTGSALAAASDVIHGGGDGFRAGMGNAAGGGSSGCPTADGISATDDNGAASAGTDSGAGGDGPTSGNGGTPGGGAGIAADGTPGTSAPGRVRITYNTAIAGGRTRHKKKIILGLLARGP